MLLEIEKIFSIDIHQNATTVESIPKPILSSSSSSFSCSLHGIQNHPSHFQQQYKAVCVNELPLYSSYSMPITSINIETNYDLRLLLKHLHPRHTITNLHPQQSFHNILNSQLLMHSKTLSNQLDSATSSTSSTSEISSLVDLLSSKLYHWHQQSDEVYTYPVHDIDLLFTFQNTSLSAAAILPNKTEAWYMLSVTDSTTHSSYPTKFSAHGSMANNASDNDFTLIQNSAYKQRFLSWQKAFYSVFTHFLFDKRPSRRCKTTDNNNNYNSNSSNISSDSVITSFYLVPLTFSTSSSSSSLSSTAAIAQATSWPLSRMSVGFFTTNPDSRAAPAEQEASTNTREPNSSCIVIVNGMTKKLLKRLLELRMNPPPAVLTDVTATTATSGASETGTNMTGASDDEPVYVTTAAAAVKASSGTNRLSSQGLSEHNLKGQTILIQGRHNVALFADILCEFYLNYMSAATTYAKGKTFALPKIVSEMPFDLSSHQQIRVCKMDLKHRFPTRALDIDTNDIKISEAIINTANNSNNNNYYNNSDNNEVNTSVGGSDNTVKDYLNNGSNVYNHSDGGKGSGTHKLQLQGVFYPSAVAALVELLQALALFGAATTANDVKNNSSNNVTANSTSNTDTTTTTAAAVTHSLLPSVVPSHRVMDQFSGINSDQNQKQSLISLSSSSQLPLHQNGVLKRGSERGGARAQQQVLINPFTVMSSKVKAIDSKDTLARTAVAGADTTKVKDNDNNDNDNDSHNNSNNDDDVKDDDQYTGSVRVKHTLAHTTDIYVNSSTGTHSQNHSQSHKRAHTHINSANKRQHTTEHSDDDDDEYGFKMDTKMDTKSWLKMKKTDMNNDTIQNDLFFVLRCQYDPILSPFIYASPLLRNSESTGTTNVTATTAATANATDIAANLENIHVQANSTEHLRIHTRTSTGTGTGTGTGVHSNKNGSDMHTSAVPGGSTRLSDTAPVATPPSVIVRSEHALNEVRWSLKENQQMRQHKHKQQKANTTLDTTIQADAPTAVSAKAPMSVTAASGINMSTTTTSTNKSKNKVVISKHKPTFIQSVSCSLNDQQDEFTSF